MVYSRKQIKAPTKAASASLPSSRSYTTRVQCSYAAAVKPTTCSRYKIGTRILVVKAVLLCQAGIKIPQPLVWAARRPRLLGLRNLPRHRVRRRVARRPRISRRDLGMCSPFLLPSSLLHPPRSDRLQAPSRRPSLYKLLKLTIHVVGSPPTGNGSS